MTPQETNTNKELLVHPPTISSVLKATSNRVSPGREAINILEDLNCTLDKQNFCSPLTVNDDVALAEHSKVFCESALSTGLAVHSPLPQHNIKDVVEAARESRQCSSPLVPNEMNRRNSLVSSSENVCPQNTLHNTESHQSVQDKALVKLGINISYEQVCVLIRLSIRVVTSYCDKQFTKDIICYR
uniref:Uncharacterized protein n=1 Tax=Angiostrongylus cantonensis TaxID=6313 RepID=A0A0K0DRS1_ANGCA